MFSQLLIFYSKWEIKDVVKFHSVKCQRETMFVRNTFQCCTSCNILLLFFFFSELPSLLNKWRFKDAQLSLVSPFSSCKRGEAGGGQKKPLFCYVMCCSRCPCLSQGFGQDDLQRSLPTCTILCFYEDMDLSYHPGLLLWHLSDC